MRTRAIGPARPSFCYRHRLVAVVPAVLDLLPDAVRAISVSQRGHGASDKPDAGYRVEDFAADVVLGFVDPGVSQLVDPISRDFARSSRSHPRWDDPVRFNTDLVTFARRVGGESGGAAR